MQVEIITIGDEILIGQIVDTNSAWMSAELNKAGFEVIHHSSISDREEAIIAALKQAMQRADIVLITGGIGPTKDDITKQTLAKFFGANLVFDEHVYAHITELLRHRRRAMNDLTKLQAMVPDKALLIPNQLGTAPITWFEQDSKVVVSLPGVPYEMKRAMTEDIIPRLEKRFQTQKIIHQNILVYGYPESALAIKIADWENNLPPQIRLAYLPQFNIVKLRLSVVGDISANWDGEINKQLVALRLILGDAILAEEDLPVEQIVGDYLKQKNKTLASAESCTGGYIAHRITSIAGSSAYFKGSIVAYNNEVKINLLDVDAGSIQEHDAVSKEVVEQMASHARRVFNTDFAIATSGIAGPGGETKDKPVGLVWIAIAQADKVVAKKFYFNYDRALNIERTSQTALLMLIDLLR